MQTQITAWEGLPPGPDRDSTLKCLAPQRDAFGFPYALYPLLAISDSGEEGHLDLFSEFLDLLKVEREAEGNEFRQKFKDSWEKVFWREFWSILVCHAETDKGKVLKFLGKALEGLGGNLNQTMGDLVQNFVVEDCQLRLKCLKLPKLGISPQKKDIFVTKYFNFCTSRGGDFFLRS